MHRRIVICPDSFKGTCPAADVAAAIVRGWRSVRPDDDCVAAPMADGGEGTIEAMASASECGVIERMRVCGPLGEPVDAQVLRLVDDTWVVELAETSGIAYLPEVTRATAASASTYGLGEAIRFAVSHGARRVLVGLGSSASTDGGLGALLALGARAMDAEGREVSPGNAGLHELASLDLSGCAELPAELLALTDVESPLLGPTGAAAVFGPQKGAAPEDIARFDAGLARLAELLDADPETPGAGAAGGTGFGLLALGARIRPGAVEIARTIGLAEVIAGADFVLTGEGSFDTQSLAGKVPSIVFGMADAAGVPAGVIAGRVAPDALHQRRATGEVEAWSLTELAGGADAAMHDTERWLAVAGARAAESFERVGAGQSGR
ncbi:glycerate kinase [Gulosibacter sp. ACHW.36C]|uniref:Glycerate kinase n=1 Tax=Gulosibacter sediminis TaxID=1729695 RepID=A0ABY4MX03_9MICO|nr:glycerate kinase [Gulosibacter sediminis]UQN14958.1 glycerate kinase [Gulosibacter sediminis]